VSHLLITSPAKILEEMVSLFADFDIDGIEDVSEIYETRGYTGASICISDGIRWRKFLERFSLEWDAQVFPDPSGDMGIKVLDWGSETAEITLLEDDIDYESFKKITDRKNIVIEFQRFFDHNPRTNVFKYNPADITSDTGHRGSKKEFYCRQHTDSSTNRDVVSRSMFLLEVPIERYEFRVLPQNGKNIDVGMVIGAPFPGLSSGTRLLLVFSKRPSDSGSILRVLDISSINERSLTYWDEGDSRVQFYLDEDNPEVLVYL